jgi:hypothetical protein
MLRKKLHLKLSKGAKGPTEPPSERFLPGQTSKSESRTLFAFNNPSFNSQLDQTLHTFNEEVSTALGWTLLAVLHFQTGVYLAHAKL